VKELPRKKAQKGYLWRLWCLARRIDGLAAAIAVGKGAQSPSDDFSTFPLPATSIYPQCAQTLNININKLASEKKKQPNPDLAASGPIQRHSNTSREHPQFPPMNAAILYPRS
jgi:hypothetical protein